jgi:hypothetical protein
MEDAIADLGRRIIEASRLAVAMHLDAALAGLEAEPAVCALRRRLAGGGAGGRGVRGGVMEEALPVARGRAR